MDVTIPDQLMDVLEQEKEKTGRSKSEIIRSALVDKYVEQK